ncbi:hypothetical protein FA95DRAFT_1607385 [Auriscalpium vulgare]|uniref:Uncharacterized protein n=1 Tax=Auriscalpium vulgare TaxID=40419 RepID=A0ACB8RNX2_9AGAM|nr:hypothetical protein FA95DRAFT_1607385 [Auriscalpium vulgare]
MSTRSSVFTEYSSQLPFLLQLFKEQRWEDAKVLLNTYWREIDWLITKKLDENKDMLGDAMHLQFVHRPQVSVRRQHRLGLNMNPEQFREAKQLLAQIHAIMPSRDDFEQILFHFSPYAIVYACMDLNIALPRTFDMRFFFAHLAQLIDEHRTSELIWSNERANLALLSDEPRTAEGIDMLRVLSAVTEGTPLPTCLAHTGPTVYVATTAGSTSGAWNSVINMREVERFFALPRPVSEPAHVAAREQYAMVDAACCFAHEWDGCTVRFVTSSQRVAWAVNDAIACAAEFPAVQLLHALGTRWNFRATAVCFAEAAIPLEAREVRVHARQAEQTAEAHFAPGSGLVHEVMDCALLSCNQEDANLGRDFVNVVLMAYTLLLVRARAPGYVYDNVQFVDPGSLYYAMRRRQLTIPKIVEGKGKGKRRAAPLPRLQPMPATITKADAVATKLAIQHQLQEFAVDEMRREARVRAARGNAVRLAAARDDSGDPTLPLHKPEVTLWRG